MNLDFNLEENGLSKWRKQGALRGKSQVRKFILIQTEKYMNKENRKYVCKERKQYTQLLQLISFHQSFRTFALNFYRN